MKPYFASPDRQRLLLEELESWRGTRFWDGALGRARKGVSADCISFVAQVLVNTGAIAPVQSWPGYVTHHGGQLMLLRLIANLDGHERLARLGPGSEPVPGDLLVISNGKSLHHVGIYSGQNTVWHCDIRQGVTTGSLHDTPLARRLVGIYRPKEA